MKMKLTSTIILFLILVTSLKCDKSKDPYSPTASGIWKETADLVGGLNKIYFIDSHHGWIVGDNGLIKHSTDGGFTWENQNSGTDSKLYSVYFIDFNRGFAVGNNNTLISTRDGGKTWKTRHVNSDSSTIYSSLHADREGNVWFISNYGDIFCSTDRGETWNIKSKLDQWGYSWLYFPSKNDGFALRFGGNELKKTKNGGLSWSSFSLPGDFSGDIFFIDENHGWYSEDWGPSSMWHENVSLYYTKNGGESWEKVSTFPETSLRNINFVDKNNGWLTEITKIYHSTDGGCMWSLELQLEDEGFIRDLYMKNFMLGWFITSDGKVYKYSGS